MSSPQGSIDVQTSTKKPTTLEVESGQVTEKFTFPESWTPEQIESVKKNTTLDKGECYVILSLERAWLNGREVGGGVKIAYDGTAVPGAARRREGLKWGLVTTELLISETLEKLDSKYRGDDDQRYNDIVLRSYKDACEARMGRQHVSLLSAKDDLIDKIYESDLDDVTQASVGDWVLDAGTEQERTVDWGTFLAEVMQDVETKVAESYGLLKSAEFVQTSPTEEPTVPPTGPTNVPL